MREVKQNIIWNQKGKKKKKLRKTKKKTIQKTKQNRTKFKIKDIKIPTSKEEKDLWKNFFEKEKCNETDWLKIKKQANK